MENEKPPIHRTKLTNFETLASSSEMDRISKLPLSIIENILCLVPIKEAARTSVLSKEWRHHWTKIPKIVFEEDSYQVSSYGKILSQRKQMDKRRKLFYAIHEVLSKREVPIHEFTLSLRPNERWGEIYVVIDYLLRKTTVKKLNLEMRGGYRLSLPICFYLLEHLTDLYLCWCELEFHPIYINGFHNLTYLCMEIVRTNRSTLIHLLSKCPRLKTLNMYIDDIQHIGDFSITNLFDCIPVVENLSIWLMALTCFAPSGVPNNLPTALIQLKYLYIDHMTFKYEYGLPILLFLIKSSLNLETLKLQIYDDVWFGESEECSYTLKDHSEFWFEHLKVLEIFNMSSETLESDFVKLILARSPGLEKVRIFFVKHMDEDDMSHISAAILSSQRASPMVGITVKRNS